MTGYTYYPLIKLTLFSKLGIRHGNTVQYTIQYTQYSLILGLLLQNTRIGSHSNEACVLEIVCFKLVLDLVNYEI